jgi:hypothetical protein
VEKWLFSGENPLITSGKLSKKCGLSKALINPVENSLVF